jgi:hypothetical protein
MRRTICPLALIGATVLGVFTGVHAQKPVPAALILEIGRSSPPALRPYTEIAAGQTIRLASNGRLVFLHYGTCRAVSVVGGSLTLHAQNFTLTGGRTESDAPRPCPRRVGMERSSGSVAGLVFRSIRFPQLPRRPTFVVVGAHAVDFGKLRVAEGSQVVLEAVLDGPRFRWPATKAPLAPGRQYDLTLVPRATEAAPATMPFTVGSDDDDVPVLLSVD